ncbi:TetR/AcrR family transcriptional regulator [Streptomyces sp. SPB074]|uniref:TetR/AcrR family transcriptional regulator n=1 Tax=Streptomyces sp. (strain SPB074) TaxID=465543 RepID=UPI0001D1E3FD|nr:TetR/AcrR family transcriptional regulator [Streptomyces sp. SPB074]EFG65324.1 transcriptional regulator SocA3 [Streptomyces sp. SPB074]
MDTVCCVTPRTAGTGARGTAGRGAGGTAGAGRAAKRAAGAGGALGRPRGFDAEEALERAMLVFWEHGYEGAGTALLTRAMGISTTSMCAAFGNKEQLFRKVLERYSDGPGGYFARAMEEPTAHAVASAVLGGVVGTTTLPARPSGCLGVQSALAVSCSGEPVRALLADWRDEAYTRVRDRLRRAAEEGDLPASADPALLARHLTALAHGIAVQAASGVPREELRELADASLRAWPPF